MEASAAGDPGAGRAPLGGLAARGYAWLVTKLRLVILLAWIAAAVAATWQLPSLSESDNASLGGLIARDSEAARARTRSAQLFDIPILAETAVVQRDPAGLSDAALGRLADRAARTSTENDPDGVSFALPIVDAGPLSPSPRERTRTAITYLFFPRGRSLDDQLAAARAWAARNASAPDDHLVGVTGAAPARVEESHSIERSLPAIEGATVGLIALMLVVTFRALGAPLVTLVSAGLALAVAVRVLPWLGDRLGVEMPREIEPLVVVLLLGIVTDYSIFFLAGLRGRLAAGEARLPASRRATAQNVAIVLTAGLIVVAGAVTLLAGKLDYFRALGPGMALTAAVGLLASVTLVPALLSIFGRAVYWPSRAVAARAPVADTGTDGATRQAAHQPLRERIALAATGKPVAALLVLVTVAALLGAATGLRGTNLGFTLIRGLPAGSEVKRAEEAASAGFAPGILAPTEVILERPGLAGERPALDRLELLIGRQHGVAAVVGPRDEPRSIATGAVLSKDGSAARMAVVFDRPPLGAAAIDDLRSLDRRMPELLREAGLDGTRVSLAGDTALASDTVSLTVRDLRRIAVAALAVNLIALVVLLRSLVAPLFLLATSVLALGATLGLTTYVFQDLLGQGELTYYVPFAAAVLLVSLGSDYNVFVVGRVWAEARRRPLREAIATAVPRASKAITVAGLALAGSFSLLALVPLGAFRELAFALGVGVVLDAFVVRSVLVPALVSLFGEVSWWPGRRRRVPAAEVRVGDGSAPEPATTTTDPRAEAAG